MKKMTTAEIQSEGERILNHLCAMPKYGNATAVKAVVQYILLKGPVFAGGDMYRVCAKSQGCGVYELTLKPKF